MAYSIVYKKSVHRDLKKRSKPEAKHILDLIEKELIKAPESNSVFKIPRKLRINYFSGSGMGLCRGRPSRQKKECSGAKILLGLLKFGNTLPAGFPVDVGQTTLVPSPR